MTLLQRIGLYALAALLCAGIGWAIESRIAGKKIAKLETALAVAQADAKASRAAITAKAAAQAQVDRTYTQRSKDLTNALQTSQDWAAAPVPDAVYDSLFPDARKADPAR
jgi:hypothetical protein